MTADLRHLRAFLQVADAGTITAAATRMHMTQPAVSRLLAQLEAHLGVRLVERSTHHLTLTGVGAAYRDRAAAAVAAVDTVLDPTTAGSWPLRWDMRGQHWARGPRHCCAAGRSCTPTSSCNYFRSITAARGCRTAASTPP